MAKQQQQSSNESKPRCGVSQNQLNDWKLKYGPEKVFLIEIPRDDDPESKSDPVCAYIRKPGLAEMVKARGSSDNEMAVSIFIMNECMLACDPEVKNDDEFRMAVLVQMNTLFKIRGGTIKNA